MLFKKSIDRDAAFKKLLLEELALEQLKFHQRSRELGEPGWMGFPWCMNVLRLRLSAEGRKGSPDMLGSLIHAGSLLAQEIQDRRDVDLSEAKSKKASVEPSEIEELAGLFAFLESLPEVGSVADAMNLSPSQRERFLRISDEAAHRLKVLIARGAGTKEVEDQAEAYMSGLSERDKAALIRSTDEELNQATQRPDRFQFNGTALPL